MNLKIYKVIYTGFCGWVGGPGSNGEIKNLAFFKLENFQKMLKKQWKFYNFLKIFKEISRFFEIFLKGYRNIRENLGKNFENMDF